MRSLPKEWQKKVLEEEAKGKTPLPIQNDWSSNNTRQVLRHLIEESLDLELLKVQLIPNGALIHCGDFNIQNKFLTLGGHSLDNQLIKYSRFDHALST